MHMHLTSILKHVNASKAACYLLPMLYAYKPSSLSEKWSWWRTLNPTLVSSTLAPSTRALLQFLGQMAVVKATWLMRCCLSWQVCKTNALEQSSRSYSQFKQSSKSGQGSSKCVEFGLFRDLGGTINMSSTRSKGQRMRPSHSYINL